MRSIIFLILKSNKFYFLKESKAGVPILSERGGVGKMKSLEESRGVGFPVYTKTEIFEYKNKKYKTPKILLSGNHKKIREWRQEHSKYKVE